MKNGKKKANGKTPMKGYDMPVMGKMGKMVKKKKKGK
jgi:hypothetical protein